MAKPTKAQAKKDRALNTNRKRLEKKESAEKEKREIEQKQRCIDDFLRQEEEKREREIKRNEDLQKQIIGLQDERRNLEKSNNQLKTDLNLYEIRLESARDRIHILEKEVETCRRELCDKEAALEQLKSQQEQKLAEDPQFLIDTVALYEEEMEAKVEKLIKESPTGGSKMKEYGLIEKKDTRNARCKKLLKCMEMIVGSANLDPFIYDFVHYLSDRKEYEFSLVLSEWDSFYAAIRWNMTTGFLREFQKFSNTKLSFGVFSSLNKIRIIKKRNTIVNDYQITVNSTIKTTRSGKEVKTSTAVVTAKSIHKLVAQRLEELHKNGRLRIDERGVVVLGFGGDKGADTTKLCIVFENVDNPNDPHGILLLGYYTGHDSYENLKEYFGSLFHQINIMNTITYREGDVDVTRYVIILPVGDCKFISAMYNHAGQSSIEPCFRCKIHFANHGARKATLGNFRFEVCGRLRTIQEMITDGNDPLLHVDPSHAAPPGLHTFIGIAQKYFIDWFIALAIHLDFDKDMLPLDLSQQRHHLKSLSHEATGYLRYTESLRNSIDTIEKSLAVLSNTNTSRRGKKKNIAESPCHSTHCIVNQASFEVLDLFQCKCKKEFHLICELFCDSDDAHRVDSQIKCLECRYQTNVDVRMKVEILNEKLLDLQSEHANMSEALAEVIEEKSKLKSLLHESSGDTRKSFESILQSIGCDHRVWYQEMTGNQTRTLLRPANIKIIIDHFRKIMKKKKRDTEMLELMGEAMHDLAYLMSQADNDYKSDEEIDVIEDVVSSFVTKIRALLPEYGVTTKIHLLSAHLVQHLRDHHSWGKVSEQGIESFHGLMNKLEVRFASVRNVTLHALLILEHFSHYNTIFDNGSSW